MVREKIQDQTRAGIIGGETAARQRCRTARTYVLAQTLRCPAYVTATPYHYYRLYRECKLDIAWWNELLTDWNGASFFERPGWEPAPDIHISSDASGKLGYGVSITTNGLKHGRWLPWNPCVLHTRNSSRSCQRVRFGVENGNKNASSSGVTTKASWQ